MFVSLSKEEVYGICKNSREKPMGKVHINTSRISYIDGNNIVVDDWYICVSDIGMSKILSFLSDGVD